MGGCKATDKNSNPDCKRFTSDAEEFIQVMLNGDRTAGEISTECFSDILNSSNFKLDLREINDNADRIPARQLSSPTYDIVLDILIQIPLSKGKWIQRVKELRDFVDTYFDQISLIVRRHNDAPLATLGF